MRYKKVRIITGIILCSTIAVSVLISVLVPGGVPGRIQWVINSFVKLDLQPGDNVKECAICPEMVVIPSGEFIMGEDDGPFKPAHKVRIAKPFLVGKFEVTKAEWNACVERWRCKKPFEPVGIEPDLQSADDRLPVSEVSKEDVLIYLVWLSGTTDRTYRLPSEAEWEYAARAVTNAQAPSTNFFWGNDLGQGRAHCKGCGSRWDVERPAPVGAFVPNAFGLYDMHGNVWEWVADVSQSNGYSGAPTDGSVWGVVGRTDDMNMPWRGILRGGSFSSTDHLHSAARFNATIDNASHLFGFRVARSL